MLVQFNNFVPVHIIDYVAAVIVVVVAIGVVYKLRMWLRTVPSGVFSTASKLLGGTRLAGLFFSELGNRVIAQRNVINDSRVRWATHFVVFWGFLLLSVATVWDDIFFNSGTLPPAFSTANLGNIIGNIGGALAIIGTTVILVRYATIEKYRKTWKGDMLFFSTLYIALISGFVTEFSRTTGAEFPTYVSYAVHLLIVAALLVSAPFTHFFHAIVTPLMRYVERVRFSIQEKKGPYYVGDRYNSMTELSESVKSGQVKPTPPDWLKKKED